MRLIAIPIIMVLAGGATCVDINKPGMRVTGLVPGSEARRMAQTEIVGEAGERGDCANAYTLDGTLITSDTDGVSVNCNQNGYGGGTSAGNREAAQAALDNPDFGTPEAPQAGSNAQAPDEGSALRRKKTENARKAAAAFKKEEAKADQDTAALEEPKQ